MSKQAISAMLFLVLAGSPAGAQKEEAFTVSGIEVDVSLSFATPTTGKPGQFSEYGWRLGAKFVSTVVARGVLNYIPDINGNDVLWVATEPLKAPPDVKCWGRIGDPEGFRVLNDPKVTISNLASHNGRRVWLMGTREMVGDSKSGHYVWKEVVLVFEPISEAASSSRK